MRFKRLRKEGKRVKSVSKIIKERVNVNPILSSERGILD
jgi:fatty acid-binding protein DegV